MANQLQQQDQRQRNVDQAIACLQAEINRLQRAEQGLSATTSNEPRANKTYNRQRDPLTLNNEAKDQGNNVRSNTGSRLCLGLIVILAFMVGLLLVLNKTNDNNAYSASLSNTNGQGSTNNDDINDMGGSTFSDNNNNSNGNNMNQDSMGTNNSDVPCSDDESCITLAELAVHNSADDCWVAFHGNVYDLTTYANRHPAGARFVTSLAGTDGTIEYGRFHPPRLLSSVQGLLLGYLEGSNGQENDFSDNNGYGDADGSFESFSSD